MKKWSRKKQMIITIIICIVVFGMLGISPIGFPNLICGLIGIALGIYLEKNKEKWL
jgi:hypothetical protein